MTIPLNRRYLNLSAAAEATFIAGAQSEEPVRGLTHGYYKYPARFSPTFVRAAIETFTRPGELCLDPHVGGGTTLVEALALGRHGIGVDISSLAAFVASVKTSVFTEAELKRLDAWSIETPLNKGHCTFVGALVAGIDERAEGVWKIFCELTFSSIIK